MKSVLSKIKYSKEQKFPPKTKEEEPSMKKIISFSEAAKKHSLRASTGLLMAFAMFFANAACWGRIYEPEVPEELK